MNAAMDSVDLAAAAWVERLARPVQDAALLSRFDAWIEVDPRHAERYGALQALWTSPELSDAMTAQAANDAPAPRWWSRHALAAAAAAACLGAGLWLAPGFAHRHVVVPAGPARTIVLEDGSRVVLAGDTELDVRLTPWNRSAALMRGEAFFDVAHRRYRPFTVAAGRTEARVLGTAFDLERQAHGGVALHVYRGAVSFGATKAQSWVVQAGEGAQWTPAGLTRSARSTADAPEWLAGWLEVDDAPLTDVVAHLNRFSVRPIVLATPGIGDWRTSGRFDLRAPRRALDGLAIGMGLTWRERDGRYIVTAAKPAP